MIWRPYLSEIAPSPAHREHSYGPTPPYPRQRGQTARAGTMILVLPPRIASSGVRETSRVKFCKRPDFGQSRLEKLVHSQSKISSMEGAKGWNERRGGISPCRHSASPGSRAPVPSELSVPETFPGEMHGATVRIVLVRRHPRERNMLLISPGNAHSHLQMETGRIVLSGERNELTNNERVKKAYLGG